MDIYTSDLIHHLDTWDFLDFYIRSHFPDKTIVVLHKLMDSDPVYVSGVVETLEKRMKSWGEPLEQDIKETLAPYLIIEFPDQFQATEFCDTVLGDILLVTVWLDGEFHHSNRDD